jgi:putative transposase
LTEYFVFYNTERIHQSLDYKTPDKVYRTASGGGASIVDKFTTSGKALLEKDTKPESKPGQRRAAAYERLPS